LIKSFEGWIHVGLRTERRNQKLKLGSSASKEKHWNISDKSWWVPLY